MATDANNGSGTNIPHVQVQTPQVEEPRRVKIRGADGEIYEGSLPPIEMIQIPVTEGGTKSVRIRWLKALGYTVNEISKGLMIKYQMVRNITTNQPKRAAREDLPPLIVQYKPEADELQDALDGALEKSLLQGRQERLRQNKEERDLDRLEGGED